MTPVARKRLLIFIVAYNAERTIAQTLIRIPRRCSTEYEVEVLVLDDRRRTGRSSTRTRTCAARRSPSAARALQPGQPGLRRQPEDRLPLRDRAGLRLRRARARRRAVRAGVPARSRAAAARRRRPTRCSARACSTRAARSAAACRSTSSSATGSSPGSRTGCCGASLSEFHSGYRVYSVAALRADPVPAQHATTSTSTPRSSSSSCWPGSGSSSCRFPTYYGDEICHVNGLQYAWDVTWQCYVARVAAAGPVLRPPVRLSAGRSRNAHYEPKLDYVEPAHRWRSNTVPPGARVLDLGCAGGYVGAALRRRKGCRVDRRRSVPARAGRRAGRVRPARPERRTPPRSICATTTTSCCSTSSSTSRRPSISSSSCATRASSLRPSTAARQHRQRRVRRQPADAAARPVQLRQARHSRPDAYAALHVRDRSGGCSSRPASAWRGRAAFRRRFRWRSAMALSPGSCWPPARY